MEVREARSLRAPEAESIVDAYGLAIELANEQMPDGAKAKVNRLCDALRDFLIIMLSTPAHDASWQFRPKEGE